MNITTGTVLIYHTCKSFDLITKEEFGKYDIHYLVEKIGTEGYHLFDLDNSKFYRVISNGEMNYLLRNKKMEISNEVA